MLSRPYRALTFGIVSVVLMIAFEATAVSTAMPVAARDLHGVGLYAFAFSGYFTTSLLAMVVSGQWCDRSGPLAPLSAGIAGFGTGLVVSGTARAMDVFVLGRAVQGLGGGLVIVALYVVVGRAYPERLRPAVMAAFSASWVVPSIVGPLVSGTVTQHLGWRWVFLAIPVLVVLPLAVMLPALRRAARRQPDDVPAQRPAVRSDGRRIWWAGALAAGAALLQYAGQDLRPLSVLPAAAGAALLVPAALRLLPRGTFRAARGLPAVVLLRGIAAGSFFAAESFVPLMLVTQRGLSPTLAGLSLSGGGLTWALGSYLQSRPGLEEHREWLAQAGMALTAAAIGTAPLALAHAVPPWIVAVAWCAGGLGMGLTISALSVVLLRLSPPAEAGANSAALQVSDALSNVLVVGGAGTVFTALGGGSVGAATGAAAASAAGGGHPAAFAAVFVPAAGIALAGMLVAARLRTRPAARG
ncbi:putative multidrug resistance efflux protein [Actinacidiphila reveromycinica]|uniref:Putative multidrug resistance efflux protein n=1 Tax=Actinacidiphila reveromycinica TaxID=659352 RepID=A0A7U3VNJ6_9ACTN|nr:putative multidrug resistance efflux protein [Streptomyces sp. SN-593]